MHNDPFDQIKVGDQEEFQHTISEQDVDAFVRLTGDDNPLHVDAEFAKTTPFKKPVVHGMLTASFISTMIGTKLPGKGALWYEQSFKFLAPVRVDETIRVCAKVIHKSSTQRTVVIETVIYGNNGRRVIEGEGKVRMVEVRKRDEAISEQTPKGSVIISGASRGIGAAIAVELGTEGYAVCVNYCSDAEGAETTCETIRSAGGRAVAMQADISDALAVETMVTEARQIFGQLDGIVCNASPPMHLIDFADLVWNDFQNQLDVQLKGAFNLVKSSLPDLLAEESMGRIVIISSTATDNVPPTKFTPYTAAKTALTSLTKSLAVEYGPKGIRVNTVSPGMTETDFIADTPQKAKMVTKMQTPLRSLAQPEDIAGVVGFLFTEKAKHLTGQNLRVCGGAVMM
ncbi:MAG: SDR family oxidoreductase [Pseudodesulfovibrio sp.]|nr:SDR family oxidoreductase [Pseudodesulfovibrio sp.]